MDSQNAFVAAHSAPMPSAMEIESGTLVSVARDADGAQLFFIRRSSRQMSFAKLFVGIFDSSLAEDWQTRIVFQDMIILADSKGIVDMTPAALARRTNVPIEIILAAIPKLEAEDPMSRTPDQSGKRIVRLDAHRTWGWRIVNFERYRESANREMIRMAEADRKRIYRQRQQRRSPPSPAPSSSEEIQRERQTSPRTSPDASGTDNGGLGPHLSETDKINFGQSLKRITTRLQELRDADQQFAVKERNELKAEEKRLRYLLGVKA